MLRFARESFLFLIASIPLSACSDPRLPTGVDSGNEDEPTPSTWIAFTRVADGNSDIYTMRPDGSGLRRLTRHPARDTDPSWSPDGRQIVFQSRRNGNFDLYLINADGTGLTQLTDGPADEQEPAWSPDGQWIAFSGGGAGNSILYLVSRDGSLVQPLTGEKDGFSFGPDWSPDGMKIAFARGIGGAIDICVLDIRNDETRCLTNGMLTNYEPAWSPDGESIVFTRLMKSGFRNPWVMDADGSNARQVMSVRWNALGPVWRSDNDGIAFLRWGGDVFNDIYVMQADGSGLERLTNGMEADWPQDWITAK